MRRVLPGAGVLRQLLPPRGGARRPHLERAAGPRQRRPGLPAEVRRRLGDRRRLPLPPARRPLPRPVRLLRDAQVPPGGGAAADPGVGPGRHGSPDGEGLRPRRGPGDERGVRLHPLRSGCRRVRPVHDHRPARRTPRDGVRTAHRGQKAALSPTRATAVSATASRTPHAARTCSCARRPSSRETPTLRTCTSPGPRRGAPPPSPARSGCCSPTSRRGTTPRRCWPRQSGSTTAQWTSRRRARPTTSSPLEGVPGARASRCLRHDGRAT